MAVKTDKGFKCSYCGKEYPQASKADDCRDSHELVYIQVSKSDLGRLAQFLITKEEELLTETLVDSIYKTINKERIQPIIPEIKESKKSKRMEEYEEIIAK